MNSKRFLETNFEGLSKQQLKDYQGNIYRFSENISSMTIKGKNRIFIKYFFKGYKNFIWNNFSRTFGAIIFDFKSIFLKTIRLITKDFLRIFSQGLSWISSTIINIFVKDYQGIIVDFLKYFLGDY